MTDELDEVIESARNEWAAAKEEADRWMRRAETLHARLAALEEAASLRPARHEALRTSSCDSRIRKGRQPGAISKEWRAILAAVAAKYPSGGTDEQIADIARSSGLPNTRAKDVRDRMTGYVNYNYVEPSPTGWRVTSYALAKFRLAEEEVRPEATDVS